VRSSPPSPGLPVDIMPSRNFLIALLLAASVLLSFDVVAADTVTGGCEATRPDTAESNSERPSIEGESRKLAPLKGSFTANGGVSAVAVTDDAVWAILAVPQRLLPTHSLIRSDIPSGHAEDLGSIGGFAAGDLVVAESSLWAAEGLGGEKVHRLDPATGKRIASIDVPRNPTVLAHGAGAVWVIAAEKASKAGGVLLGVRGWAVHRIDPASNQVVASVPIPTVDPPRNIMSSAMLAFASGAVWAGDGFTGAVVRIDPAGERAVATIEPPRSESPDAIRGYRLIAVGDRLALRRDGIKGGRGPDAGLVTDVTVWEIDTVTNRIRGEPAQVVRDGVVLGIVDGVGWLGSTRTDGLTRVDPFTLKPRGQPVLVGHPVHAIAGGRGSLVAIAGARRTQGDGSGTSWAARVAP
jgi:hypothetical protein